ncbi:MAG: ATP-binding protein [Anaerolineae bacterium]|nr:ATP-binding protein [Anaerolineae bacterium]
MTLVYVRLQLPGPEELYDVIDARYERGSILLTSNRVPNEWPELFGDPLLASAAGSPAAPC